MKDKSKHLIFFEYDYYFHSVILVFNISNCLCSDLVTRVEIAGSHIYIYIYGHVCMYEYTKGIVSGNSNKRQANIQNYIHNLEFLETCPLKNIYLKNQMHKINNVFHQL